MSGWQRALGHLRSWPWLYLRADPVRASITRKVAAYSPDHVRGRVLDVGAGEGMLGEVVRQTADDYLTLDVAQNAAGSIDVIADAHALPFGDGEFHTVVCLEVLEHLERPGEALSEMRRVLTEGGRLVLTAPFMFPVNEAPRDYFRFTRFGLESLLSESGFRALLVEPTCGPIALAGWVGTYVLLTLVGWSSVLTKLVALGNWVVSTTIILPLDGLLGLGARAAQGHFVVATAVASASDTHGEGGP